jgi:hypothetical protein
VGTAHQSATEAWVRSVALADVLKAAEQPGSGLVRELFMHGQNDLHSGYILAVFEN